MLTRREFLKISAAGGAAALLAGRAGSLQRAFAQQGPPLAGSAIPKWVDPLPLLSVAGGPMETILAGEDEIVLRMREFRASVLPSTFVPATGAYSGTWVWGYRAGLEPTEPAGTYLGPVIIAARNQPTQVRFVNELTADHIAWREWTDQSLHWADPLGEGMRMDPYQGPIPACVHVHGGELPPALDGGPDSWFTNFDGEGQFYHGHAYYTHPSLTAAGNEAVYRYPNSQEASMIWFHDHLLGGTRLNVYAGLAGAYPIVDPNLPLPAGLHPVGLQQGPDGPVDFLVPLVLQDRAFDVEGQLFFPNLGINPEHPYWIPEFVGDSVVVNGKTWPFFSVEPRRYRFLFVNGSNARTFELFLVDPVTKAMGPPIWQIGTDGGYLDFPVKIDPNAPKGNLQRLVLMPGERADVIVDFAGHPGSTLILRNIGRHPFPKGAPPGGSTLGQVVQIRVGPGPAPDASYDPASGIPLRPPMVRLVDPAAGSLAPGVTAQKIRQLTLNEVIGAGGPLEVLVNNTRWSGLRGDGSVRSDFTAVTVGGATEYYSELPNEGELEVWEIVNLTADAHPIHTHLTQFQLINRQGFNASRYNAAYSAAFPGGVYLPAFGPPLDYGSGNPRALGGNPDITPYLQGPALPPLPNEAGWKDTVMMLPGQVTRLAVRFAPMELPVDTPAGQLHYPFNPNVQGHGFVWHCHIVDHEDNEMMRPYAVTPKPEATRTYLPGEDY